LVEVAQEIVGQDGDPRLVVYDRAGGPDLTSVLDLEWLDTNGLRAYACGTAPGIPTRKYHGLLVADVPGQGGRHVFLNGVEATAEAGGREFDLSTFQYPGVLHPDGIDNLLRFEYGSLISCQLMLVHHENSVLIRYELLRGPATTLNLQPLISCRPHHHLTKCNPDLNRQVEVPAEGAVCITPYPTLPTLRFDVSGVGSVFATGAFWNYNVQYEVEKRRGFPASEDLFCPGRFVCELRNKRPVIMRASIEGAPTDSLPKVWQQEKRLRARRLKPFIDSNPDDFALGLAHARAGELLVENSRGESSVIAGYPWFDEWGRDTMIALPGLTVYRGANKEAMAVLESYAAHARVGLIPNILGTGPEAGDAYNSVDASLWFFRAIQEYDRRSGDRKGVITRLLPTMEHLVDHLLAGKAEHVRIRPDGLFEVSPAGASFTWMDACVNGQAVTPRDGLAVDLNAMWYNALRYVCELQEVRDGKGRADAALVAAAERAQASFTSTFWVKDGDYLADVVRNGVQDRSVRPNQLVAVAVEHSPLTRSRMHGVVERCRRELVTPVGLRTLSPADPRYVARYEGSPTVRDSSYHQGTVWPWLIGLYADACLRAAGETPEVKRYLRELFRPLYTTHLREGGLLSVSEILDGEAPRRPRGCFAQAWSIAEVIRVLAITAPE
jgi:predicted glycogen debranching enzyme